MPPTPQPVKPGGIPEQIITEPLRIFFPLHGLFPAACS